MTMSVIGVVMSGSPSRSWARFSSCMWAAAAGLGKSGPQPIGDRLPYRLRRAGRRHHADMAERRAQHGGASGSRRRTARPRPAARCGRGSAIRPARACANSSGRIGCPPTCHPPRAGSLSRYHDRAHSQRDVAGQRHAVVDPVFERDEIAGRRAFADRARRNGRTCARRETGRARRTGIWMTVDRQRPGRAGIERQAFDDGRQQPRLLRRLGVEVPRRREQRQAGDVGRPAQRQSEAQQPAHAIAEQRHRPPGAFDGGRKRVRQRAGDVVARGRNRARSRPARPNRAAAAASPRAARWRGKAALAAAGQGCNGG